MIVGTSRIVQRGQPNHGARAAQRERYGGDDVLSGRVARYVSTGCSSGLLAPDSAVTVLDGPPIDATDVTTFRLDRLGRRR